MGELGLWVYISPKSTHFPTFQDSGSIEFFFLIIPTNKNILIHMFHHHHSDYKTQEILIFLPIFNASSTHAVREMTHIKWNKRSRL